MANNIINHKERDESSIRLNKFISEKGVCSRREADRLIEAGKVMLNGEVAAMGSKVSPEDEVKVNGKVLTEKQELVYIALNKPVGITCTTDRKIKGNVIDFMNYPKRIFMIGRLDKPSQGLLLMTNDGDIVNKILRAGNNHEKEYVVCTDKAITPDFIKGMSNGVFLPELEVTTKACTVKQEGKHRFRIILTQGYNRQIRRMCEVFGYKVTKLERLRIMNIKLGDIPVGKWRYLTAKELLDLNVLVADSSKVSYVDTYLNETE